MCEIINEATVNNEIYKLNLDFLKTKNNINYIIPIKNLFFYNKTNLYSFFIQILYSDDGYIYCRLSYSRYRVCKDEYKIIGYNYTRIINRISKPSLKNKNKYMCNLKYIININDINNACYSMNTWLGLDNVITPQDILNIL